MYEISQGNLPYIWQTNPHPPHQHLLMTILRAFLSSEPAWSTSEQGEVNSMRPVTTPPLEACAHQKSKGAGISARMGLAETGGKCCDNAVPPTCFLAPNDVDKGGKVGPAIAVTKEGHKLMSAFLIIRNQYCFQLTGTRSTSTSADEPLFPDSKGKLDPKKTSDFRLFLLNKAVYGKDTDIKHTPQDFRKWNTTFLANHSDPMVQATRADATGNTENVFKDHYDITRQARVLDTLMQSFRQHNNEDEDEEVSSWSQDIDNMKKKRVQAIEEANEAVIFDPPAVDVTCKSKPVHLHLRNRFHRELDRIEPGLWGRAGSRGAGREMAVPEAKWMKEVLTILGREDAEELRNVIFEQYRGMEHVEQRQWSGLFSHLEALRKEGINDGTSTRNCPLMSSLRMFFSSAR